MFSLRGIGSQRRVDRGLGKFQSVATIGTAAEREVEYQGWRLRSWGARVGMTQPRDRFSVRIVDPKGLEVKYLSGFATRAAAEQAAQQWIVRVIDGAEVRRRRVDAALRRRSARAKSASERVRHTD